MQVFAQFCCSYLLPGCLINALHFLSQPSVLYLLHSSPIHPAEANGPGELRSPQDRCGVGTLSLLESSYAASPLKYGARWDKRRTPGEGFSGLFSGIGSLKNFVQILDRQVFALIQKTDCLSRQAASLTFSCIAFSKVLCILES